MKQVTVRWLPESERFEAGGTHAGQTVVVNAPHEGPPTGFSAKELLLAGVGACSSWDVVEILAKQRQQLRGVTAVVTGEQAPQPPWPFTRIEIRYEVAGRALRPRLVERAVRLSVERYCSVIATVRGVSEIVWSVSVRDETAPASAE
jgi:putative redox protein